MLYSRPSSLQSDAWNPLVDFANELCPKWSLGCNYDVIPELSLGPTQKLILSDEETLRRQRPEERIFEHLCLIVNCHENAARVPGNFYKIGVCSTGQMPDIICQQVHKWYQDSESEMNRINDVMQAKIWDALQRGTVVVHCLAGIHRAACIVACHFLWRHYVLRDRGVTNDVFEIYACLKAARPHVEPAYGLVLERYKKHLQSVTA